MTDEEHRVRIRTALDTLNSALADAQLAELKVDIREHTILRIGTPVPRVSFYLEALWRKC